MNCVVLGSGGWGTALSLVLCRNGHHVTLWSHSAAKADALAETRENPLLPKAILLPELQLTASMDCLRAAELVVFATPSFAVRETGRRAAPYLRDGAVLVSVSKGIEKETDLRMSQLLQEETGDRFPVVALSGPSHAEEVGIEIPTGCVAAHPDETAAQLVQDAFMNDVFRVYTSRDIVGVELAAALKNVIALSCGVIDGMGYGDNTKALLMTRAMAEMGRLGERMGGEKQTFAGLAGMGDLIVTCTSLHSRNLRAGRLIGQGKAPREAMDEIGAVVEGYFAADSVHRLAEELELEMPICQCAYEVLYCGKSPQSVVRQLMTRAKKTED
ncbi:MAG: NAD(P)H-dependent glycerol-3-phosphate dehydrogenase [Oscillospiraceae bacterium]